MDAYRTAPVCCVCDKPIMILEARYTDGGVTAHLACATYVNKAAKRSENSALTLATFKAKMRAETDHIPK